MTTWDIQGVNSLTEEQFEWTFGNVIELCTDAAVQVAKKRPLKSVEDLVEAFHSYLDGLSEEGKVVILKLHPDLAGRLADLGHLTKESADEQSSAGLNNLTLEQKYIIDTNNEKYKSKFGFPFIICARENKVQSIIDGLQRRYSHTRQQEVEIATNEVKKICKLRIFDIVS